ncbi:hypothetical protein SAVIM40S_01320 [Streptomyces avidinii]
MARETRSRTRPSGANSQDLRSRTGSRSGDRARVPGLVLRDPPRAQDAQPVEGGGGGGVTVLQQGGAAAVDAGAQGGQCAAGVARVHEGGQVGRFGEVDAGDLLGREAHRLDPVGGPGATVVDVQDLAGEAHLGREAGGVGGDPVHDEAARVAAVDSEFLAQLARGRRGRRLAGVHGPAGEQPVGAVVDALDEDPAAGVGDEDDGRGPHGGPRGPVLRRGHPGSRPLPLVFVDRALVGQLRHRTPFTVGGPAGLCNSGRGPRVTAPRPPGPTPHFFATPIPPYYLVMYFLVRSGCGLAA